MLEKKIIGTCIAVALAAGTLVSTALPAQAAEGVQGTTVDTVEAVRAAEGAAVEGHGVDAAEITGEEQAEAPVQAPVEETVEEVVPATSEAPEAVVPAPAEEPAPEAVVPEVPRVEAQSAEALKSTVDRKSVYIAIVHHKSQTASYYLHNGYRFSFDMTAQMIAGPTPFKGTLTYFKTVEGVKTELGSQELDTVFEPRVAQSITTDVLDEDITVGPRAVYTVEYTEVAVAPDGTVVELEGRQASVWLSITSGLGTTVKSPSLMGRTVNAGKSSPFVIDATVSTPGIARDVFIQRYDDKSRAWKDLRKVDSYTPSTGALRHSITAKDGVGQFRVRVAKAGKWDEAGSNSVTIKREQTVVPINNSTLTYANQIVGQKNTLKVQVYQMTPSKGQTLSLQQYDAKAKKWVSIGKAVAPKTGYHSFALSTGSSKTPNMSIDYRVLLSEGDFHKASSSSKITVALQNPAKMSALEKEYYSYSKKYCPTVVVRHNEKKMQGKFWGWAEPHNNVFYVTSKAPKKDRKTVAQHECAHFKQRDAGNKYPGGWSALAKKLDSVYGSKPYPGHEYNADCVANYWSKNSYWGYKTPSKCNSALQKQWTKAIAGGGIVTAAAPKAAVKKSSFIDVPAGHKFEKEIAWMQQTGLSTGVAVPGGKAYQPQSAVSREAMAAFIFRMSAPAGWKAPKASPFADVPTSHKFYREIAYMGKSGISTGVKQSSGKPKYLPKGSVSREAMAAFLARMAGNQKASGTPFADVSGSQKFSREIAWMHASGISTGSKQSSGKPKYLPKSDVTREAMAAFLQRYSA